MISYILVPCLRHIFLVNGASLLVLVITVIHCALLLYYTLHSCRRRTRLPLQEHPVTFTGRSRTHSPQHVGPTKRGGFLVLLESKVAESPQVEIQGQGQERQGQTQGEERKDRSIRAPNVQTSIKYPTSIRSGLSSWSQGYPQWHADEVS